jgi:hypothetical protein
MRLLIQMRRGGQTLLREVRYAKWVVLCGICAYAVCACYVLIMYV